MSTASTKQAQRLADKNVHTVFFLIHGSFCNNCIHSIPCSSQLACMPYQDQCQLADWLVAHRDFETETETATHQDDERARNDSERPHSSSIRLDRPKSRRRHVARSPTFGRRVVPPAPPRRPGRTEKLGVTHDS
jgi:hypothetical protein